MNKTKPLMFISFVFFLFFSTYATETVNPNPVLPPEGDYNVYCKTYLLSYIYTKMYPDLVNFYCQDWLPAKVFLLETPFVFSTCYKDMEAPESCSVSDIEYGLTKLCCFSTKIEKGKNCVDCGNIKPDETFFRKSINRENLLAKCSIVPRNLTLCHPFPYYATSSFGYRIRPGTHSWRDRYWQFHHGFDISDGLQDTSKDAKGNPIYAFADGQITYVGPAAGYGYEIVMAHPNAYNPVFFTVYGHINSDLRDAFGDGFFCVNKDVGIIGSGILGIKYCTEEELEDHLDIVKAGQEIAYEGNTGISTGPHLHFEIRYPVSEDCYKKPAGKSCYHQINPCIFLEDLMPGFCTGYAGNIDDIFHNNVLPR